MDWSCLQTSHTEKEFGCFAIPGRAPVSCPLSVSAQRYRQLFCSLSFQGGELALPESSEWMLVAAKIMLELLIPLD